MDETAKRREGGLTLDQLRTRRAEILRIAEKYDARNVRIFGSVARGEADQASDLDILVDIETERRGLAYVGLLEDFEAELSTFLGVKVEIGTKVQEHAQSRVLREVVPL